MARLLIVDDNSSIHQDFQKVLQPHMPDKLRSVELELFGEDDPDLADDDEPVVEYQIDNAFQGEEALEMADRAADEENPYALVFMDVRMPPGMDGVRAASLLFKRHPMTEIVICSAHSDYSWSEIVREIGATDRLQFLRKPFDTVSVQQMALSCTQKIARELAARQTFDRLREDHRQARRTLEQTAVALAGVGSELQNAIGGLPQDLPSRSRLGSLADTLAREAENLRRLELPTPDA